jgi:hypothetical protein
MDAWKDYLKLFILLSPNQAYVYNIVAALHHHLVKKKLHLEYLVSLTSKKSLEDWKVSNFLLPVCLPIRKNMIIVCLLSTNVGDYLMWKSWRLHLILIINLHCEYFVTKFQNLILKVTTYISWCTIFILQLYLKNLIHNS